MVTLSVNTIYTLTSTLLVTKPNVTLAGQGWSTILRRSAALTGNNAIITASGAGFTLRDMTVDGASLPHTSAEVEVVGGNSLVTRCQIINGVGAMHLALQGNGSRASLNTITGVGTSDNTTYGIWAIGGFKTFINGNIITGTGIDAIGFNGNGTQITGNHISGCQCHAIPSTTGGGQIAQYEPNTDGALIEGNYIGQGGGDLSLGMELYGLNITIVGNVVVNQRSTGINIASISGGKPGILISGNTILNSGAFASISAPWLRSAIALFGPFDNTVITGNRLADTQTTPTQAWGVYINPETYNNLIVTGNDLSGNAAGGLLLTSVAGTGHVVANNLNAANAPGVPTINAANDAAAASAGVIVGGEYRNGSIKMVRVA